MTCTPVPRNTNCAEFKGYNPICLLSLMQKIMQKLLTTNIRGEPFGYVPYIYTNLPTNYEVHRNHNALCDYTYTRSSRKQEVTLELS